MPSYDISHKVRDMRQQTLAQLQQPGLSRGSSIGRTSGRGEHGKRGIDEHQRTAAAYSHSLSRAAPVPRGRSSSMRHLAVPAYTSAPVMCRALGCEKLFHSLEKMERHWRERHSNTLGSKDEATAAAAAATNPPVESWESRRAASLALFSEPAEHPFIGEPSPTPKPRLPMPALPNADRTSSMLDVPAKLKASALLCSHTNPKLRDSTAEIFPGPITGSAFFSGPIVGSKQSAEPASGPRSRAGQIDPSSSKNSGRPRFGGLEFLSGPQPERTKPRDVSQSEGSSSRGIIPEPRSRSRQTEEPLSGPIGGVLSKSRERLPEPFSGPLSAPNLSAKPEDLYPEQSQRGGALDGSSSSDPHRQVQASGRTAKKGSIGWPFGLSWETLVKGETPPHHASGRSRSGTPPRPLHHRNVEVEIKAEVSAREGRTTAGHSALPKEDSSDSSPPRRTRGCETFLQRLSRRSFSPKSAARATEGIAEAGRRQRTGRGGDRAAWASRSLSVPRGFLAAARKRWGSPGPFGSPGGAGFRFGSPGARSVDRGGEEKRRRSDGAEPERSSSGRDLDRSCSSRDLESSFSSSSWFFSRGSKDSSPAKSGPLLTVEWPMVPRDGSPGVLRREREAERMVPSGAAIDSDGGGEAATPEGTPRKGIGSKLVMALRSSSEKGRALEEGTAAAKGDGSRSFESWGEGLPLMCKALDDCKARFATDEELELHMRIYHSVVPLWAHGSSNDLRASMGGLMGTGWLQGSQQMGVFESALDIHNTPASGAAFEGYRQGVMDSAAAAGRFWKTPSHGAVKWKQDGNEVQRFYGTSIRCNLGINDRSRLCDSDQCELCCILRSGFKFKRARAVERFGWGIHTSSTVQLAHENYLAMEEEQSGTKRAAILVCQVIAGRVCKLPNAHIVGPPPGYDSVVIQKGGNSDESNFDELIVFDKRALLPLYAIIYRPAS